MAYEYVTPRNAIIYHKEKCGNAYECLKCVEVASNEVGCVCLGWMNTTDPDPKTQKRWEDIDWKIITSFMADCFGCGECVKACPKDALELKKAEPREPAVKVQRSDIVYCYTLKDGTKVGPRDAQ
jgi:NAD-dependent dihydropyrimidine dehydrogenase PreA subunit